MNKFDILCTVGPSSLNDYVLTRFKDLGVNLLRINLSHTKKEELRDTINYIRSKTDIPICLDTEGAQIRTGPFLKGELFLKENTMVALYNTGSEPIESDAIMFYPENILDLIEIGDIISIDFNSVLTQVVEKTEEQAVLRVLIGGLIRKNKAVTILDRDVNLPVLTKKDVAALAVGRELDIRNVALSFANHADDILEIKKHVLAGTYLISKIESIHGLLNLKEIAAGSDAVLIDRGDLSRQVGIEKIPWIQKMVIKKAKVQGSKVFVATNLLESMVTVPYPTRAEVNDIFNTLADGADGLVLAAEAAIGAYPVHCVAMVSKMMEQFSAFSIANGELTVKDIQGENSLLLIEPHGGNLVGRFNEKPNMEVIQKQKCLAVDYTDLMNVEQIALGTLSPLAGFMNKEELESVLETYRLPDGIVWPLPIVLQVPEEKAKKFVPGETVNLISARTKEIHGVLHVESLYTYDLKKLCLNTFGTMDSNHPGVRSMLSKGASFMAGPVELTKRLPSLNKYYELTPRQVRTVFESRGWSKVVGFHTRNVIHKAHEHIQKMALNDFHCDGLFIHPIVGPKKTGDYSANIILKSYELMIEKEYYPKEKVLLAAFQNYSRYCGPREAVFTALCRKNFGCSHFIVGRDHTGVEDYYEADAARKLFEKLGDIGIEPIFFNEQHYCKRCKAYVEKCAHGSESILRISGTDGRNMLTKKVKPPEWFMRQEISELILDKLKSSEEVFLS